MANSAYTMFRVTTLCVLYLTIPNSFGELLPRPIQLHGAKSDLEEFFFCISTTTIGFARIPLLGLVYLESKIIFEHYIIEATGKSGYRTRGSVTLKHSGGSVTSDVVLLYDGTSLTAETGYEIQDIHEYTIVAFEPITNPINDRVFEIGYIETTKLHQILEAKVERTQLFRDRLQVALQTIPNHQFNAVVPDNPLLLVFDNTRITVYHRIVQNLITIPTPVKVLTDEDTIMKPRVLPSLVYSFDKSRFVDIADTETPLPFEIKAFRVYRFCRRWLLIRGLNVNEELQKVSMPARMFAHEVTDVCSMPIEKNHFVSLSYALEIQLLIQCFNVENPFGSVEVGEINIDGEKVEDVIVHAHSITALTTVVPRQIISIRNRERGSILELYKSKVHNVAKVVKDVTFVTMSDLRNVLGRFDYLKSKTICARDTSGTISVMKYYRGLKIQTTCSSRYLVLYGVSQEEIRVMLYNGHTFVKEAVLYEDPVYDPAEDILFYRGSAYVKIYGFRVESYSGKVEDRDIKINEEQIHLELTEMYLYLLHYVRRHGTIQNLHDYSVVLRIGKTDMVMARIYAGTTTPGSEVILEVKSQLSGEENDQVTTLYTNGVRYRTVDDSGSVTGNDDRSHTLHKPRESLVTRQEEINTVYEVYFAEMQVLKMIVEQLSGILHDNYCTPRSKYLFYFKRQSEQDHLKKMLTVDIQFKKGYYVRGTFKCRNKRFRMCISSGGIDTHGMVSFFISNMILENNEWMVTFQGAAKELYAFRVMEDKEFQKKNKAIWKITLPNKEKYFCFVHK